MTLRRVERGGGGLNAFVVLPVFPKAILARNDSPLVSSFSLGSDKSVFLIKMMH